MREETFYICEVCGESDSDKEYLSRHEQDCFADKAENEKRTLTRQKFGQLTLKQLIAKCELFLGLGFLPIVIDSDTKKYHGCFASGLTSYRGNYHELAIVPDWHQDTSLQDFLKQLKDAVNSDFAGWKGGEYTMKEDTFLWVDECDQYSGLAATDLVYQEGKIFLVAKKWDND